MAVCASLVPQPDGTFTVALDPSNTNFGACQYVLQSGSDFGYGSLYDLTSAQALEVGMAVVGCWIVGWTFKQVARSIGVERNVENES